MATTPDTQRHDDATIERRRELGTIDDLIAECKNSLAGVSSSLISSVTKDSMEKMYREIRQDAERDELRKERLSWMRENVVKLRETVSKAAAERARFEADVAEAVESKWMSKESAARWMRRFEDPSLLEMYRSEWLAKEWNGYRERWKALAEKRARVLETAKNAGVRATDLPELAAIASDETFLADRLGYHERKTLVDKAEAAVTAREAGTLTHVRAIDTMLAPATKGADRHLHPGKLGAWLKKVAADPATYTKETMAGHLAGWKRARKTFDALAARFEKDGRPDGCTPMAVNSFLEMSYETRLSSLAEWERRLDAAARLKKADAEEFDKRVLAVRRAVDLRDLDEADAALAPLLAEHPHDEDLASIAAHVATLRVEDAETEKERTDEERTTEAIAALEALPDGVPSVLARHYEHLLEGSADQAATFFTSMKMRTDRRASGKTDAHDEYLSDVAAEETEGTVAIDAEKIPDEATATPDAALERPDNAEEEPVEDVEVLVTKDTQPAQTIALIRAHGAARPDRAPALVVEGVPYEQHLQLVAMNQRALAHMRHLESMGKPYGNREKDLKAA